MQMERRDIYSWKEEHPCFCHQNQLYSLSLGPGATHLSNSVAEAGSSSGAELGNGSSTPRPAGASLWSISREDLAGTCLLGQHMVC